MLASLFLTLGGLFLVGLATDLLGRRTRLPRVSLLLCFGFTIGPSGLDLLPPFSTEWRAGITDIALVMVGFLLGESLTWQALRERGREVLWMSITVTLCTALCVFIGLWLLQVPLPLAVFLAGIATATDPIATADVIHEARAQGPFSETLRGVVAIDDAWGLLLFTLLLIAVDTVTGHGSTTDILRFGLSELLGSLGLGLALGIPMAILTGRVRPGEPTQAEALGFVFLCAGLALWAEVSFTLAAIILGITVANLARHHQHPFNAIEGIEWPFLILFFVFAGASLDWSALRQSGLIVLLYIALRIAGRILGSQLGGRLGHSDAVKRRWLGLALLPQAGVATGMALIAAERYPDLANHLISVVIGSTVFFEVIGPLMTRYALECSHESMTSSGKNASSTPSRHT